jgi:hypothetical protein
VEDVGAASDAMILGVGLGSSPTTVPGGSGDWSGHSMTLSARSNSDGGIVTPRVFAIFWLITNSNREICWTGSAAGDAPLKIRSTY